MIKKSLAMIVIGSFVSSNSFAAPLHLEKLFMKNGMTKSFHVSHKHNKDSQSKFSGTWVGVCSDDNDEIKFRISEYDSGIFMLNLMNEGDGEYYSYNRVRSENESDKDWFYSSTHRLTKVNENTLKFEYTDVDAPQLPSSDAEKDLTSTVYNIVYTVNNNQLTMKMNGTVTYENKNANIDGQCTFKRVE